MRAQVGDHVVVEGRTAETPRREGEVVEVRGPDGQPPYSVRWSDGHEGIVFPGADAHVMRSEIERPDEGDQARDEAVNRPLR